MTEFFEVECILGRRAVQTSGGPVFEYKIKWKGFDHSHNTWEPTENLNCPEMFEAFEKNLPPPDRNKAAIEPVDFSKRKEVIEVFSKRRRRTTQKQRMPKPRKMRSTKKVRSSPPSVPDVKGEAPTLTWDQLAEPTTAANVACIDDPTPDPSIVVENIGANHSASSDIFRSLLGDLPINLGDPFPFPLSRDWSTSSDKLSSDISFCPSSFSSLTTAMLESTFPSTSLSSSYVVPTFECGGVFSLPSSPAPVSAVWQRPGYDDMNDTTLPLRDLNAMLPIDNHSNSFDDLCFNV